MGKVKEYLTDNCTMCGESYPIQRSRLGYEMCMECGEREAKKVKHCQVPMNKSNYVLVTDREVLKQLNPKYNRA